MGALENWLGRDAWSELERSHLGVKPFAKPGVARAAASRCSWSMLNDGLRSTRGEVLIVRGGRQLSDPLPQSLADLHALFEHGKGIALRGADDVSDAVRDLASSVAQDLPGKQRVILFATAPETHGFGWHFDPEEVFIVQTEGEKTYYLRANTVTPRPFVPSAASFAHYPLETSPLLACDLHPGDLLYIPSGYWHMAIARRAALSVSIGIFR